MSAATQDILSKFRAQLLNRRSNGLSFKSLGRTFKIFDDRGNYDKYSPEYSLSRTEFKKGLTDYGVLQSDSSWRLEFTDDQMNDLFAHFDKDKSDSININEFMDGVRSGYMSDSRKKVVEQAFSKMDKTGDGVITAEDMKRVYNARQHPKFEKGEMTEDQVFEEFLKTFEPENGKDGKVTKAEFMDYYAGLSASYDNDAYFDHALKNAWKL